MDNNTMMFREAGRALRTSRDVSSIVFVNLAENDALDPTTIAEHAELFERYVPGIPYKRGQIRIDPADGVLYKCITAHGAEHASDAPLATNNLWQRVADPADEWPEWFPATGVFDQWMQGSQCTHDGVRYISQIDHNVTVPGTDERWWKTAGANA